MPSISKFIGFVCFALLVSSCTSKTSEFSTQQTVPRFILWAWERPENLKFIDSNQYGVAFLEQTLRIEDAEVIHVPRLQPLKIESKTYLLAVTRIETQRGTEVSKVDADKIIRAIVSKIVKSSTLRNVKGVQIDFDAVESERQFYREIILGVKQKLRKDTSLSITALASWCAYDLWLKDLPIDEAIPMLFDIGTDRKRIEAFLKSQDWNEPLCGKSYGLSINQPSDFELKTGRRKYYFNSRSWIERDLDRIK